MEKVKYFFVILLLFLLVPASGQADRIVMKNGDRLTGKILLMDPSTVTMQISYAGKVKIIRSDILEMHTDKPLRIMLSNNSLTFGNLSKSSGEKTLITDNLNATEGNCTFSDIAYLNPPPHIAGEGTLFTGDINVGGELKEGNTVSVKLALDFKTQYDRGKRRYLFNGDAHWESKNRIKSENKWFVQGRYNRLFAPKWYSLGNMSMEFDEFKGLMMRSVTGGGAGYRFWDDKRKKLSIELGPNFVYQNQIDEGKSYYVGMREGGNFEFVLPHNDITLFHNHSVLQDLMDTDNMSVRTSTGLQVPLGILGIHSSFELKWDWDSKPTPGRQNSDTTFLIKGGYGW